MTKRLSPLLDDQSATSDVRELLQAGRDAQVADYDYNAGLERHVAQVKAGAPMPDWAKGLEGSSGTGGAVAVAGSSLVGWLALPAAIVAIGGAVAWLSLREPEAPEAVTGTGTGSAIQAAPTAVSAGTSTEGEAIARAAGAPNHAAGPVEHVGRGSARTSAQRAGGSNVERGTHGRGALAVRSPATSKRANAAGGTRPDSKATSGATGKAAPPAEDLFAGSPVPTATRADNATRTPAASVAADAERAQRAGGSEATRSQAPSEQGAAREEAKPEPVALDDTRLEREMGMLSVAQRVLLSDPARSLSLARQGEAEFAGSMFTQERKQLELLALVKLGRVDEAKRLARPYLARYPNGPFSDRVRRALATGRVER